jgi:hypothetical protein
LAIAENPKRNTTKDAKAERFIAGAGKQPEGEQTRKPIMLRVKPGLLGRIDKAAERLSLTRTGFILSSVSEKLERMESGV